MLQRPSITIAADVVSCMTILDLIGYSVLDASSGGNWTVLECWGSPKKTKTSSDAQIAQVTVD